MEYGYADRSGQGWPRIKSGWKIGSSQKSCGDTYFTYEINGELSMNKYNKNNSNNSHITKYSQCVCSIGD